MRGVTDPFRLHLKVLIRFSFLSEAGFRNSRAGVASVREMLYDPARLERRFAMFEALTLPSLLAQTSQDMDVIILTGETLPKAARAHLDQIMSPLPRARVVALPVSDMFPAIKSAFASVPSPEGTTHVATMRMDDDDAMNVETIANTHRLAPMISAATRGEPFVLSYQSGVVAKLGGQQPELRYASLRNPPGSGPVLVAPVTYPGNVYRRNHRALAQFYPVFSDATPRMFLRTIHQDNDSDPVEPGKTKVLGEQRAATVLKTCFGIDPESLAALG